jgi:hypothetical protein
MDEMKRFGVKLYNISKKVAFPCGNVRKFNIAIEKIICKEYVGGKTFVELGAKYKCDPATIGNILKKHDIDRRKSGHREGYKASAETKKKQSESMKGKVRSEESKKRMSESAMGKAGTNTGKTFDDEWRKNQAKSLKGKQYPNKHRFTGDIAQEICDLYHIFQYSASEIARTYDCYKNVIRSVLVRCNIPIRPSIQAKHAYKLQKFSTEVELQICDKYDELENYAAVGRLFGCDSNVVKQVLSRNNKLKGTNDQ